MRGLRSFLLGLLIVVGVLAVLLAAVVFGGDGIIRDKVEEQAARTLRSAIGSSATPQVTVEGYPVAWRPAQHRRDGAADGTRRRPDHADGGRPDLP